MNPRLLHPIGVTYAREELRRLGYIVDTSQSPNSRFDIVVTDPRGAKSCSVKVKTRQKLRPKDGWQMTPQQASIKSDDLFYCLVDFGDVVDTRPRSVYLLPSMLVVEALIRSHQHWVETPGRKGRPHKDTQHRKLMQDFTMVFGADNPYPAGWLDPYRDGWHLLGLDPNR
jgi:hypothetical protein